MKLRWLIDNNKDVQKAIQEDRCMFGTVDSWLIWVSSFVIPYFQYGIYVYVQDGVEPAANLNLP